MSGVVVTGVPRPDAAAVAVLASAGVATVHEAQGRTGLLQSRMRPVWKGARIAGRAVTVSLAPCDNWMIHVAVEQCEPGDVLVVAPSSASDAGFFGDLLATSLKARGVRGLVIDGGCRDVAQLEAIGFPVWSSSISAQGTVKETLGSVNLSIVCAGQLIHPGDVVVADDDGVVAVTRLQARTIADQALAREAREGEVRERLAAGELGLDIYAMRDRLRRKGLVYREFEEY